MIVVFCQHPGRLSSTICALPAGQTAIVISEISQLPDLLAAASIAILSVEGLPSHDLLRITALTERQDFRTSFLFITNSAKTSLVDRWNRRGQVLSSAELKASLADHVTRALARDIRYRVAGEIESIGDMAPALRYALSLACRSSQPIRTIAELARRCRRDRRTLWHHWRRHVGTSVIRPKDFLDWILLFRAVEQRRKGGSWSSAAAGLGIHPRTLCRLTRRLVGSGLRELSYAELSSLQERFSNSILSPLRRSVSDKMPHIGTSCELKASSAIYTLVAP